MASLLLSVGAVWANPFEDSVAAYQRGDYTAALQIDRSLAAQGDVQAQTALGVMYEWGNGVSQDYVESIKWFRIAAERGDALAQRNLGFMYERGNGVTQDYAEAIKLFRLAAIHGDATAQNDLGAMYVEGHGVTQDYVEAAKWFRLAATQGHAEAQASLGWMYLSGLGVARNLDEAQRLLDLAEKQNVNGLSRDLPGLQRQLKLAKAANPVRDDDSLFGKSVANGVKEVFFGTVLLIVMPTIALTIYFLPASIGSKRHVSNPGALFFVNLFFGWTLVGWVVCLIWAVVGSTSEQDEYFRLMAQRAKRTGQT
jgi:hypothetical protein